MAPDGRRFGYAAQRFWQAVEALASGTGSIQQRLDGAARYVATGLREEEIPPDMLEQFRALVQRLTCVQASGDEGSISATTRAMADVDACAAAKEIVSIFLRVAPDFYPPRQ